MTIPGIHTAPPMDDLIGVQCEHVVHEMKTKQVYEAGHRALLGDTWKTFEYTETARENGRSAAMALEALRTHAKLRNNYKSEPITSAVEDLIADLAHLLDSLGLDLADTIQNALSDYSYDLKG